MNSNALRIVCPGLEDGGVFPPDHTGRGRDLSPEIRLENLNPRARTLVVILEDLSHPIVGISSALLRFRPAAKTAPTPLSPPLPTRTASPDSREDPGGFTHWVLWNYPAGPVIPGGLPGGKRLENGALQGTAYGLHRYAGPKPPPFSRHRYRLTVYALDCVLGISSNSRKRQFLKAAEGHILQKGSLTAGYGG